MNRREIVKFLLLRTVGNFLVLFALFGVGATFGPALYFEISFRILQAKGITYQVATNTAVSASADNVNIAPGFSAVMSASKNQLLIPKDTYFDVLIPKIGANAKVFPNVDPANETEYLDVLKQGVAHAKGTVFPGMTGSVYLFAHSTDNFWDVGRYNAVFYLLKDLTIGDDIILFFQNKRFNYHVVATKIVSPNDIQYIQDAQKVQKQQVILQTCWPPGTTLERLLVFAEPSR